MKNVARAPVRWNSSRTSRVFSTTRLGSWSLRSGARGPSMPHTWNHSSTSTVRQLRRPSTCADLTGGLSAVFDEVDNRTDATQHSLSCLLVRDDHSEGS